MPEIHIKGLFTAIELLALIFVTGWVGTTWLRVKHRYPLKGSRGYLVHPLGAEEQAERVTLLTQENAQLRAEMAAMKDRLATVERIVTDRSYTLEREIASLSGPAN